MKFFKLFVQKKLPKLLIFYDKASALNGVEGSVLMLIIIWQNFFF